MNKKSILIVQWVLVLLFCFRVFAQITTKFYELSFLPPFESWHSGSMPYELLLVLQFIIILAMFRFSIKFGKNDILQNIKKGKIIIIIGAVYFIMMIGRLIIGLAGISEARFFVNYLTTSFHYVLASYLMLCGFVYVKGNEQ